MSTNLFNPSDKRSYPSRWPLYRGKQLFRVIDERSEDGSEELLSVSHITGITPRSQKNVTMFQAESLVGYKLCQVGDIAANTMWTWQGAIGVSDYAGVVSPAYNVYRQNGDIFNPRFLDMLLRERGLVDVYHSLSTGIRPSRLRLYPDVFLTIRFPVPAREEQDQIVRYLDWKLSGINRLIANKRKQINEYDTLRLRLITKMVMQGLNPSAPMKKVSEWIEEIPVHWDVIRIRRMFNVTLGKMLAPNPKTENETFEEYFCAKDIHFFKPLDLDNLKKMWFSEQEKNQYRVMPGDLLVVEGGATGSAVIVQNTNGKDIYVQNSIHIIRPKNDNALNEYLFYWLFCLVKRGYMKQVCSVATIAHYTKDKVLSTPMPLPPIDEQRAIVEYLKTKLAVIDSAVLRAEETICLLHEMKKRIVTDVATGKIDVRGIEIPDYEYVADESDADSGEDADIEGTDEQEE